MHTVWGNNTCDSYARFVTGGDVRVSIPTNLTQWYIIIVLISLEWSCLLRVLSKFNRLRFCFSKFIALLRMIQVYTQFNDLDSRWLFISIFRSFCQVSPCQVETPKLESEDCFQKVCLGVVYQLNHALWFGTWRMTKQLHGLPLSAERAGFHLSNRPVGWLLWKQTMER